MFQLSRTSLVLLLCATTIEAFFTHNWTDKKKVNKAPVLKCPIVPLQTANRGEKGTVVTWPSPQVFDEDPKTTVILESGYLNGTYFTEGTYDVKYTATDHANLTGYCIITVIVRVIRCEPLHRPRHGAISCNINDDIYGRRCRFSCDPDYDLVGEAVSRCQRNGNNSANSPVCEAKTCDQLTLPDKGEEATCNNEHRIGSICSLYCQPGFGTDTYGYAICRGNLTWEVYNWECYDTQSPEWTKCDRFEKRTKNITLTWDIPTATDNEGPVNIKQTKGPAPGAMLAPGSNLIEYKAVDGAGNEATRPCAFSVLFEAVCPSPNETDGLTFRCLNNNIGSFCHASCQMGTTMVGAKYIRCELSGDVSPPTKYVAYRGVWPQCTG